jgi:hypothetical protein
VLECLDVEHDPHLIEEIDTLQAEHVDDDDDGDEEDEDDPGEEIATMMPGSSGLVSESVQRNPAPSRASEVKSLHATSVEFALNGYRTNVAQLLLLKMPLLDVFKASSDATTTPGTTMNVRRT